MTKDEQLGDNNPSGDIVTSGAPSSHDIVVGVLGPATLHMSIISTTPGSAACQPTFSNPLDSFPSIILGQWMSTATLIGVNGNVTVSYTINCPTAGFYCFQIVANEDAAPGNGNTASQAENQVCATVVTGTDVSVGVQKEETYNVDVSVDTTKPVVVTVNNTINAADVLVHITAISAMPFGCQVRVVPDPANPYAQTYNEYYTTENPANLPNPDTFTSQVQFTIPAMAANSSQTFVYDYTIHCFERSYHTQAFELQVDALPLAPVYEQNLGLNQFPCGGGVPGNEAGIHGPHDNVDKNCPDVTSYDLTDLQKSGCTLTTGAGSYASGTPFLVTSTCTINDLGPTSPVDYSDSTTLSMPPGNDCQITNGALNPQVATGTVAIGTPVNVSATWMVECSNPSDHTFTANDTVSVATLHVKDPNPKNNTGSASSTTAITTTGDPSVSGVTVTSTPGIFTSPGNVPAGTHFPVTVSGTVAGLDPPASGTAVFALAGPADCMETPTGSQSLAAANGAQSATWDVVCANGSDHNFIGTEMLVPALPNHVIDSNPNNNTGTASATTAVLLTANLTATISGVTTPIDIAAGGSTTISPVVTIQNAGPGDADVTWSVAILGSGASPCTVSAITEAAGDADADGSTGEPGTTETDHILAGNSVTDAYNATISVPAGDIHDCGYTVTVTANATGLHQSGTATTTFQGEVQSNVLVTKYCIAVGPAAVNLSDTNGRYEFDICEIGNVTANPETVSITDPTTLVTGALPTGCARTTALILPGATTFTLGANEQKVIVYRVRYECHGPAVAQVISQTVTFTVTHVQDVPGSPGDVETFTSDNTKTVTKQVIIQ